MWKLTLGCNVLVLALFWLLSQVAITPAHNLLVQYTETGVALPIVTDVAIQVRSLTAALPLIWAIITLIIGRHLQHHAAEKRHEWLAAHTSTTLCLGLLLLLFFSLAGILPVLKIGSVLP